MSHNTCDIYITQGKNKGKTCSDANTKCRHKSKTCELCKVVFQRDTVYNKHIKICKPRIVTDSAIILEIRELKNVIEHLSSQTVSNTNELKETVAKIQPSVNFNTNIQIVISDVGAFKVLCDKMGSSEATDFLCSLANKPKVIALFEKVYLDCEPTDYPIANNNGKDFYYRDGSGGIICDAGGHHIAKLGTHLMQNAFLEATDPLLKRFMCNNEGDHEGDDEDYDRARELQNGAYKCKEDKTFRKDLYDKTYNPKHMFFCKEKA